MTPERLKEITHHIDRGHHPTRPMAQELLEHIAQLEIEVARSKGRALFDDELRKVLAEQGIIT